MQSDDIFIYKDFELQGKIQNFIKLNWVRRYNSYGQFELTMQLNKRNIELIRSGNIIYKGSTGEAAYIEDIYSNEGDIGAATLNVTGRFLSCILDRRAIITYSNNSTLKNIVNDIIYQYFINSKNKNRNINFLRVLPYTLLTVKNINIEIDKQIAYDVIESQCIEENVGFKVLFNPHNKTFDFTLYEGKETPAEFSENYKNIIEQDYYRQTKQYKNTCLIEFDDQIEIYGDKNTGIDRREVFTGANRNSLETVQEQARLYLLKHRIVESFDTVINSKSPQFIYKKDFDLGDIVSNNSEMWDFTIRKNILEVTEYFGENGTSLSLVFGDIIPELGKG